MQAEDLGVSVVIKALNEQRHIERAIRSSLAAVQRTGRPGEVILADSLSEDRTVEIARSFPIRIVQLVDPGDRSCGIGAQLGHQVASGRYIYILDGDMEFDVDFLRAGIEALEADPTLAGVAGLVEEMHVENLDFKSRVQRATTAMAADNVDSLNMGGLYRREAIDQVGYLTNRNLHAFEEFELGARLVSAGWRLRRLGIPAVRHYGHTDESMTLLKRRWKSRYAWGHGELVREAFGRAHFWFSLSRLRVYKLQFGLMVLWLSALAVAASGLAPAIVVLVGLGALYGGTFALLALRKKSATMALYSLLAWHVGLAGLVRGALSRPRGDPAGPFAFRVLQ